jgi:NADH-quinone oxidoreductase E subunit
MMETSPGSVEVGQVLARAGHTRGDLIPILQDVQQAVGWLSPEAIDRIAKHLSISKANVYGVATFYAQFRFKPIGRYHVKVCCGTACHVRGANRILERLEEDLKIEGGATSDDGKFSLEEVACFGSCALAPVIVVNEKAYGRMTSQKIDRVLKGLT